LRGEGADVWMQDGTDTDTDMEKEKQTKAQTWTQPQTCLQQQRATDTEAYLAPVAFEAIGRAVF
jgi:hypothetical protein